MTQAFGDIIREWRAVRRLSQMDLSLSAGLSTRHLSFLESGRAAPSRSMVLRLGEALRLSKADLNRALNAAGFAALFPSLPASAPDLAPVYKAISHLLARHEPWPAFAIDRHWDLISANAPALALFSASGAGASVNVIEALIAIADGDLIENWEENACIALSRLRAEIAALGADARLQELAARLAGHPRLADFDAARINFDQAVIPTTFKFGGRRVPVFSTIAQFGSVQDAHASEIRIELMFPANAEAEDFFQLVR
jgi:transcriptional regulator with XRE-family HTH domain